MGKGDKEEHRLLKAVLEIPEESGRISEGASIGRNWGI